MKTIAQQLEQANADLATANARIAAFDNEKAAAVAEALKPVQAEAAQAKTHLATEQTAHTATKALLTTAQGEVTALKAEAKTAEQRAAQIAASQGVKPVPAEDKKAQGDNAADLKAQFKAMKPGHARSAFFAKHRAALLTAD